MNKKISTGFWIGIGAFVIYELLSPQIKAEIKSIFNVHHGELGALASVLGVLTNNPKLTGAGAGLMFTDLQDEDQWFNSTRQRGR